MGWTTPKTDWDIGTSTQEYNGDRFTYEDFNRIKNNILYMYQYAVGIYPISANITQYVNNSIAYRNGGGDATIYHYFYLYDGEDDRTIEDFPYADEFNYFEERLHYLNVLTGNIIPEFNKPTYFNDNGVFIDYEELNKLESICLVLQPVLYNMYVARRRLAFRLSQDTNHIDL